MIPFMDLKRQYDSISKEIDVAFRDVCTSASFIDGQSVKDFEKNYSIFLSVSNVISTSNGTDALFLAYKSLGLQEGDEVIVPTSTFVATASAVTRTGAKVVFADCDKDTWEIDPKSVEDCITDKTKAVVGVHLYGQPFDISSIKNIADKNELYLIEDCAQAHAATYDGVMVGSFGDVSAFSFYPGKNLGAYGDAGAVVTNNDDLAKKIRMLCNHGSLEKYHHDIIGYNMRMDGIQAAVLNVKLPHLLNWSNRRCDIANQYRTSIKNKSIKFQKSYAGTKSVYHLYVVEVDNRKNFIKYMFENGIGCAIHYPFPCHKQLAYDKNNEDILPNSEWHAGHCVSLPMFPELTDEEVLRVIDVCNGY